MSEFRHFQLSEFDCRGNSCCGGDNRMDLDFISQLDELRERCGFPLTVTSGYRCPIHNTHVSSTGPEGPHVGGRAADLQVSHTQAYLVLKHALNMGFEGIGVNQKGGARFIHLDRRPNKSVWSY